MSTELPDFTTAPAWMDALGGVVAQRQVMDYRGSLSDFSAGAPWTPLDTADGWVRRIDSGKLAGAIGLVPDPSYAGMGTRHVGMDWAREMADAVLAALPELIAAAPTLLAELADEVERMRALTTVEDAMVGRAAREIELHAPSYRPINWPDDHRELARVALEAALGVES